jgi:hypothetical protein
VSTHDPNEGRGYNRSDPLRPFCPEDAHEGARKLDPEAVLQRRTSPHACELTELDVARGIARRLRSELIYGMPASAQLFDEASVPTSRNLPMFMEFIFEVLTGTKGPGAQRE